MRKVLVAFATMAGSTMEVAEAVGEEIAKSGVPVNVLPISEIENLQAYEGVVVGGPMIMGWHREALRFIKKHRKEFQKIPLAVFVPLVVFHVLRLSVPLLVSQEPVKLMPGDIVATINILLSFMLAWVAYSELGEVGREVRAGSSVGTAPLIS